MEKSDLRNLTLTKSIDRFEKPNRYKNQSTVGDATWYGTWYQLLYLVTDTIGPRS